MLQTPASYLASLLVSYQVSQVGDVPSIALSPPLIVPVTVKGLIFARQKQDSLPTHKSLPTGNPFPRWALSSFTDIITVASPPHHALACLGTDSLVTNLTSFVFTTLAADFPLGSYFLKDVHQDMPISCFRFLLLTLHCLGLWHDTPTSPLSLKLQKHQKKCQVASCLVDFLVPFA